MNNEWRDPQELLNFVKDKPFIEIKTDRGERKGDLWWCPLMKCPVITSGPGSYFFYHKKLNNCCPYPEDVKKFIDHNDGPRQEILGWKFATI